MCASGGVLSFEPGLTNDIHCYIIYITGVTHESTQEESGDQMILKIDFNSDKAIYLQLRNQIIIGIATSQIEDGEQLPSVRQLAENIGINMHTVNKAYSVLKQEGFVKLDRRRGAVIALDYDKVLAMQRLAENLQILLAEAICKNIDRNEVHALIDEIMDDFGQK